MEELLQKPVKDMTPIEYLIYKEYLKYSPKTGQNSKAAHDAIEALKQYKAITSPAS